MMVIIPIGLAAVDLVAMILTNQTNERLAEDAARAASNQIGSTNAENAAHQTVDSYAVQKPIATIAISEFNYDLALGQVLVGTTVTMTLPVPLSGWSEVTLHADAIQPIVAIPAAL